ncbi:MAG: caspase family protein, partial [Thermoplasmata archaeon]|nr:caspase family protein [Thermoplasmata archaeon]
SPTDDYSFSFTTEAGPVNKYAVCVGIDKHDDGTTCLYADNDGQDWRNELNSQGYSVTLRLNTAADKAVIMGDIADMDTSENAGDYCAFTFAGHGGVSSGTHYIVCADFDGTWATVISDDELDTAFSGFSSTHIFFFLDTCHSGGMNEVAASGRLFLAACKATQNAYGGDSSMQNGVWTWFFLEDGIQTQGYTIMEDCFAYAAPLAKDWVATNYGATMDPQMTDQYTGDFYL